jgi:hypothetical protein
VPGLSVIEGSGRTTGAFSNWYNGVTGLASPQYTTSPFTVTVQAADIYGNFNYYAYNAFKVLTSATTYINPYPASFPTNSVNYYGYLGDYSPGRSTFTAMYDVSQARDVDLRPQDLTPAGPSSIERVWTVYPAVPIATSGSLEYQIIVKGVDYGSDGTNSVNAAVSPDTFALTVNVVDSISKKPVYGVNAAFRLVAVYAIDINTPTGVPLTVPLGGVGNVVNGVFTTIIEGYSMYDLIRIKVEDPNAVPLITTGPRYSCIIDFGTNPAPTPAPTFSMTDTPEITPTVTMTDTPEITPTVTMTDTAVQSPTNTETPTLTITVTTTPVTLTVPAQGLSYVFPQPANTTVNFVYFLTAQADITIRVYDISGVLKASVKSNGNAMALNVTSMNLSRLPSGFYLYTITGKTASNSNINFKTGRLVILKKIP